MAKRKAEKVKHVEPRHCDDYIDDETQPTALRAFLDRARMPAHGHLVDAPFPRLFATYLGQAWNGIKPGARVRVVMASRMGDVGVTDKLDAEHGYQLRCYVEQLGDFKELP